MTIAKRPAYDASLFAAPPARDARFTVKEQWIDCHNHSEGDPLREVEFFHRQMNEEINGMENAARNLADFPDADWEIRMCIARQCSDEARHVEMFRQILEERGGHVGMSPVLNFQFRIITNVDTLVGRLAVQNRSFEAEGVDAVDPEIQAARERGDTRLSELYDAQLADEICHVRFANEFIDRKTSQSPISVMHVGRALDYAARAFVQVMGEEAIAGAKYSTNEKGRLEAGFKPEEVRFAAEHRAARKADGRYESI